MQFFLAVTFWHLVVVVVGWPPVATWQGNLTYSPHYSNTFKRYSVYFYYDRGIEIKRLLLYFMEKGIGFSELSPYVYN